MPVLRHIGWVYLYYVAVVSILVAMAGFVGYNEIYKQNRYPRQDIYKTTDGLNITCDTGKCSFVKAKVAKVDPTILALGTPVILPVNGVVNFFVSCESDQCSNVQVNDTTQAITPEEETAPAFGYPINLLPGETAQFVVTCDHGSCSTKEIKEGEREPTRIYRRSLPAANDAANPKHGAVIFKLVCETGGCIISQINGIEKRSLENEEPVFDQIPNSMLGSPSDK